MIDGSRLVMVSACFAPGIPGVLGGLPDVHERARPCREGRLSGLYTHSAVVSRTNFSMTIIFFVAVDLVSAYMQRSIAHEPDDP